MSKKDPITTLALGEEEPIFTTDAIGEEEVTTYAIGEEEPVYTTLALGEEDDGSTLSTGGTFGSF